MDFSGKATLRNIAGLPVPIWAWRNWSRNVIAFVTSSGRFRDVPVGTISQDYSPRSVARLSTETTLYFPVHTNVS